ncbi:hypothetical protein KIPB_006558, partial [Kipferlia bialata]
GGLHGTSGGVGRQGMSGSHGISINGMVDGQAQALSDADTDMDMDMDMEDSETSQPDMPLVTGGIPGGIPRHAHGHGSQGATPGGERRQQGGAGMRHVGASSSSSISISHPPPAPVPFRTEGVTSDQTHAQGQGSPNPKQGGPSVAISVSSASSPPYSAMSEANFYPHPTARGRGPYAYPLSTLHGATATPASDRDTAVPTAVSAGMGGVGQTDSGATSVPTQSMTVITDNGSASDVPTGAAAPQGHGQHDGPTHRESTGSGAEPPSSQHPVSAVSDTLDGKPSQAASMDRYPGHGQYQAGQGAQTQDGAYAVQDVYGAQGHAMGNPTQQQQTQTQTQTQAGQAPLDSLGGGSGSAPNGPYPMHSWYQAPGDASAQQGRGGDIGSVGMAQGMQAGAMGYMAPPPHAAGPGISGGQTLLTPSQSMGGGLIGGGAIAQWSVSDQASLDLSGINLARIPGAVSSSPYHTPAMVMPSPVVMGGGAVLTVGMAGGAHPIPTQRGPAQGKASKATRASKAAKAKGVGKGRAQKARARPHPQPYPARSAYQPRPLRQSVYSYPIPVPSAVRRGRANMARTTAPTGSVSGTNTISSASPPSSGIQSAPGSTLTSGPMTSVPSGPMTSVPSGPMTSGPMTSVSSGMGTGAVGGTAATGSGHVQRLTGTSDPGDTGDTGVTGVTGTVTPHQTPPHPMQTHHMAHTMPGPPPTISPDQASATGGMTGGASVAVGEGVGAHPMHPGSVPETHVGMHDMHGAHSSGAGVPASMPQIEPA